MTLRRQKTARPQLRSPHRRAPRIDTCARVQRPAALLAAWQITVDGSLQTVPADALSVLLCCSGVLPITSGLTESSDQPHWDVDSRRLYFRGKSAKRLRRDADNMQIVLDAFQRTNWPRWIADPLPRGEVDVRDRLYNTAKNLNRHFKGLLHFSCDGRGTGIVWRATDGSSIPQHEG